MPRFFVPVILSIVAGLAHGTPLASSASIAVGTYPQEMRTAYTMADGLPSDDVLSVAVTKNGEVFAGTSKGLAKFDGKVWRRVEELPPNPVTVLQPTLGGLYAAIGNEIYLESKATVEKVLGLSGPVISLADSIDSNGVTSLLVATGDGLTYCRDEVGQNLKDSVWDKKNSIHGIVADGYILWIAADSGAFVASTTQLIVEPATNSRSHLFEPEGTPSNSFARRILPHDGTTGWSLRDVKVIGRHDDLLILAAPQGVAMENGDGTWNLYSGRDGLPYNDFTSMDVAPDGRLWLGTTKGAIHFDGAHWAYRAGKRWLPNDEVRDIAATEDGAWIATAGGVSHIFFKPMTFAEKAKFYEDEIDRYHRRTPFEYVAGVSLETAGDKSTWEQHDTDNDGQYTGLYGAGECLAYAATGDPKAKERATKAFEALAFLSEVTQSGSNPAPKGFIARTILPTDGPNPNEHNSPESDRKKQESDALWKVIIPRWPTSADGKWYWKTDASSDELDGHFLLYGLYFDHVAETEAEKARVREVTARVMNHLIEHDFKLVDHDGQPTRWANFSPAALNGDPDWWAERGLNSLSMLTYLTVAHHVTGDQKYRDVFLDLVRNHHYAMNGMVAPKLQAGPGSYVQFDDKMAFMNYYHLIRYEKDPEILRMFQNSIFYYWQIEQYERNPFFNFVYAACCLGQGMKTQWGVTDLSPTGKWLEDSVDTLKRFPMDLIMWPVQNSHRTDLLPLPSHVREPGQAEGKGYRVDNYVIPVDERNSLSFSEDVWRLDEPGGDGTWLDEGGPFLLGYYLGLYHGFISE